MYEKEIEKLESLRGFMQAPEWSAINTAIALMRAAEPKDAAAEREHCAAVAHEYMKGRGPSLLSVLLERERAAARAEGYESAQRWFAESLKDLHAKLADTESQLAHTHKVEKHLRDEAVELRRQLEKK